MVGVKGRRGLQPAYSDRKRATYQPRCCSDCDLPLRMEGAEDDTRRQRDRDGRPCSGAVEDLAGPLLALKLADTVDRASVVLASALASAEAGCRKQTEEALSRYRPAAYGAPCTPHALCCMPSHAMRAGRAVPCVLLLHNPHPPPMARCAKSEQAAARWKLEFNQAVQLAREREEVLRGEVGAE